MNDFSGRVAVITGACSPLGGALAQRCLRENMKVVLADRDQAGLDRLYRALKTDGYAEILAVSTDVSLREQLESLAQQTLKAFGGVHLLVNAEQLEEGGTAWETSWDDWQRVLKVNLWGAFQAVKVFVPLMLEHKGPGHVLNISSTYGLHHYHPSAPFQVSQSALMAFSENLCVALQASKSPLKVSVLCAGPPGVSLAQLVDLVFQGIRQEQFYLLPDPLLTAGLAERLERILQQQAPNLIQPTSGWGPVAGLM